MVCFGILAVSCSGTGNTDLVTSDASALDGVDEAALECEIGYARLERQLELLVGDGHVASLALSSPNADPSDPAWLPSEVPESDMFAIVTLNTAIPVDEFAISPEFEAASATIYRTDTTSAPSVTSVDVNSDGRVVLADTDEAFAGDGLAVGFAVPLEVAMRHEERLRKMAYEVLLWPYSTLLPRWDVPVGAAQGAAGETQCPPPSVLTDSASSDEVAAVTVSLLDRARFVIWLRANRFGHEYTVSDMYATGDAIVELRSPIKLADFDPADEPTAYKAEVSFPGNEHLPTIGGIVPLPMHAREIAEHFAQSLSTTPTTTTTTQPDGTNHDDSSAMTDRGLSLDEIIADIESSANIVSLHYPLKAALEDESRLQAIAKGISVTP